ncbi:MAG: protein kinase [Desulfobacterales bacterium]
MKRIGKYLIRGLLGRGGMGKVFQVEIPTIGKIAALKLLDPHPVLISLLGAERLRELFLAETVTMAGLQHPNIVAIRDFGEDDGRPFYIMDYFFSNLGRLIGETRQTEEPSRTIRLDRAIELTRQTLSGLACLHHFGIVHRDIKPFNLLIDEHATVKICDFGLSRLHGEPAAAPTQLKVGSPWYAAPEQEADPDAVDPRADLYSVGITLIRMLTGALPPDPPAPPSGANPDLDETWDGFLLRAIDRDPRRRFESAAHMQLALEGLERRWRARRERACRLAPPPTAPAPSRLSLRRTPVRIDPARARTQFGADRLWRPARFVANDLAPDGPGALRDRATGLVWQQSGSPYPLTWHAAQAYVKGLARRGPGDGSGWRLPTAPELMSLLSRTPHGEDFCLEPAFDPRQTALWSADRRSFTAAWFVDVAMGFAGWQDFSARLYVRAVAG